MSSYNEDEETMSVEAIPSIAELNKRMTKIIELVEFLKSSEMTQKSQDDREQIAIFKYQDDIKSVNIIRQIVEDPKKNLKKISELFQLMGRIKNGQADLHEEYEKFGERQNEEYVYPQFGGKDAFEKKIKEMNERVEERQNQEKKHRGRRFIKK
jgi:hypothetical protein